jgi:tetratricopeptide (TPR) repeat protein
MRAGIVALAIVVVIAGFALWALRNEKRANAARADADELNTYLLSDVREQLEEVGRLDLLEAAAQRAQAYLTRLGPPADVLQHTQRLLLAHNLGRLRQSQGRLGQARDILQEADVASRSSRYQQSAFKTARARILNALCDLRARTGENAEGQQAGRDSLGILSSLGGVDLAALRTDTLVNLCDLQKLAHEYDAAEASITQALQLIEPLTKPTEGARTARRLHLRALLRAGDLASARGNAAAAQAAFENRLKTAQNYSEVDPPTSLWKVEIALSHDRLAQYWLDQTQLEKAASSADGAVALWNDLLVHDPDNLEWLRSQATARTKRGQIFLADQDFASASEIFTIVIALNDKLVHTAPDNLNWRAGLATSHSLLGDALGSLGDTAAALREARIALGIRRELHKDKSGQMDDTNTRNLALSLTKTAGLLMQNGDYPEAEKLAEEAHAIAREVAERPNPLPDHRALLASAIETHGETLIGQERQPKGLKYYQEAKSLRIALVHDFPDDVGFRRRLADCHESIAELEKDRRETQNARTELNSAIMLRRRLSEQLPGSQTDHDALARSEAARQALDKVDK